MQRIASGLKETSKRGSPVVLSYTAIKDRKQDLSKEIEEAFGVAGLGLLVVKGVPNYPQLRKQLLPLAHQFASLPEETKQKYVNKESHYSFGWSHGKEHLKKGIPDIYKGSYYNNPQYDVPTTDSERIRTAPEVCSPNIWPREDFPQLEKPFKELGQLIIDTGCLLAYHCDKHVVSKLGSDFLTQNYLENIIRSSHSAKARLLHYFEMKDVTVSPSDLDNWCGWHNDHGSLTGLCSALYVDIRSGQLIDNPDPEAGLYIQTRQGGIIQVSIPADCLAFQIGESSQILSGGILQATPHAVKAVGPPSCTYVARDTFAVFMQPNFDHPMTVPTSVTNNVNVIQFKPPTDFGGFCKATVDMYYNRD